MMAALLFALGLCAEPVEVKLTEPQEIRDFVPAEGWRVFRREVGLVYVGADSVVTICPCEVKQ